MIAEAAVLAGLPCATDPWPMVVALATRADRFVARTQLLMLDAVQAAIAGGLGGDITGIRRQLHAVAYPKRDQAGPMVFAPNIFAEDDDGE